MFKQERGREREYQEKGRIEEVEFTQGLFSEDAFPQTGGAAH